MYNGGMEARQVRRKYSVKYTVRIKNPNTGSWSVPAAFATTRLQAEKKAAKIQRENPLLPPLSVDVFEPWDKRLQ